MWHAGQHRLVLMRACCAGAISETEVVVQFLTLLAAGLGVSYGLDRCRPHSYPCRQQSKRDHKRRFWPRTNCTCCRWAGHETPTLFYLAIFGSIVSYIYSAPPLKLKQSGWIGNYALGSSYIALPWLAGQVLVLYFSLGNEAYQPFAPQWRSELCR